MPEEWKSQSLLSELLSSMPAEEDTSALDIQGALLTNGMQLKCVNKRFHKKGGLPEFFLLKEEECRLFVAIKLTNRECVSWCHFVAWDGKVIHDIPNSCNVDLESNRAKKGNKDVFKKLFPEEEFPLADVGTVFELQGCSPSKS